MAKNSYPHKTYGKTYVPVFLIVDWEDPPDSAPRLAAGTKPPQIAGPAATSPKNRVEDIDGREEPPLDLYEQEDL